MRLDAGDATSKLELRMWSPGGTRCASVMDVKRKLGIILKEASEARAESRAAAAVGSAVGWGGGGGEMVIAVERIGAGGAENDGRSALIAGTPLTTRTSHPVLPMCHTPFFLYVHG